MLQEYLKLEGAVVIFNPNSTLIQFVNEQELELFRISTNIKGLQTNNLLEIRREDLQLFNMRQYKMSIKDLRQKNIEVPHIINIRSQFFISEYFKTELNRGIQYITAEQNYEKGLGNYTFGLHYFTDKVIAAIYTIKKMSLPAVIICADSESVSFVAMVVNNVFEQYIVTKTKKEYADSLNYKLAIVEESNLDSLLASNSNFNLAICIDCVAKRDFNYKVNICDPKKNEPDIETIETPFIEASITQEELSLPLGTSATCQVPSIEKPVLDYDKLSSGNIMHEVLDKYFEEYVEKTLLIVPCLWYENLHDLESSTLTLTTLNQVADLEEDFKNICFVEFYYADSSLIHDIIQKYNKAEIEVLKINEREHKQYDTWLKLLLETDF